MCVLKAQHAHSILKLESQMFTYDNEAKPDRKTEY